MALIKFGGNKKLTPGRVGYLSMPADFKVCGRNCPGCYAKRVYRNASESRWVNYRIACDSPRFEAQLAGELTSLLTRKAIKGLRLCDSGEFFSQAFIDSLARVLKQFPSLKVYGFTKRIREFNFKGLMALPNVVIIDSLKYGRINYGDADCVSQLEKAGAHFCLATKNHSVSCNHGCAYCFSKAAVKTGVVFLRH